MYIIRPILWPAVFDGTVRYGTDTGASKLPAVFDGAIRYGTDTE